MEREDWHKIYVANKDRFTAYKSETEKDKSRIYISVEPEKVKGCKGRRRIMHSLLNYYGNLDEWF